MQINKLNTPQFSGKPTEKQFNEQVLPAITPMLQLSDISSLERKYTFYNNHSEAKDSVLSRVIETVKDKTREFFVAKNNKNRGHLDICSSKKERNNYINSIWEALVQSNGEWTVAKTPQNANPFVITGQRVRDPHMRMALCRPLGGTSVAILEYTTQSTEPSAEHLKKLTAAPNAPTDPTLMSGGL